VNGRGVKKAAAGINQGFGAGDGTAPAMATRGGPTSVGPGVVSRPRGASQCV